MEYPDSNLKKVANKYGYNVKIGMFNSKLYKKNYFDYIVMDQVIEHIQNPVEFLKDVRRVLRPGGKLVMSTPNFSSWSCKVLKTKSFLWHVPYHLQFFDENSMVKCLKRAGYSSFSANYITNTEWILYELSHVITYPKKGEKSEYLDYPRTQRGLFTRFLLAFTFVIHLTGILKLISIFLDSLKMSDNIVYTANKE